jgi:NTP pyrophosphatase (non-canonical NTP hydrolase)
LLGERQEQMDRNARAAMPTIPEICASSPGPLNLLAREAFKIAADHGFHPTEEDVGPSVPVHVANLHGEVSELWEAFRKGELHAPCNKFSLGCPLTCAEEEIADVLIRALDFCAQFGIDADRAVAIKMSFNRTRPHRHGGKIA